MEEKSDGLEDKDQGPWSLETGDSDSQNPYKVLRLNDDDDVRLTRKMPKINMISVEKNYFKKTKLHILISNNFFKKIIWTTFYNFTQ